MLFPLGSAVLVKSLFCWKVFDDMLLSLCGARTIRDFETHIIVYRKMGKQGFWGLLLE
jgi:hypothetical protein